MATTPNMHTIVALVEDRPGVLNRISSKWRQRGFNIESLAVGHSEVPGLSRMTFVVDASNVDIEQVTKQLYKVIDVVKIIDITHESMISREMALIKVRSTPAIRSQILEIVDIFRSDIIDVTHEAVIIEVTGDEQKVNSIYEMLQPYGILEMVRTGRVAMVRGSGVSTPVDIEDGQHRHAPRPDIGPYEGD